MDRGREQMAEIRLRQGLLARIGRRYAVARERLTIGGIDLEFTRIADPDRVLDEVAAEEDRRKRLTGVRHAADELHLPYWAELWDSAIGVGQFLAGRGRPMLHGSTVLDLGCGMGLAGTVAAALGARILFADLESPALLFAALNSLAWRQRVRTRRLNWRKDRLEERFELIIGADILYEKQQWEHLERFWRGHLKPEGRLVLGEPGRQTGERFVEWIRKRGWAVEQFEEQVMSRPLPIRIFQVGVGRERGAT